MTNKKSNYKGKRELSRSQGGVSEIIGNLLILAITVTLFSTVLYYVVNMPSPQKETDSDFKAVTAISGTNFYVNITHQGGEALKNSTSAIYLYVNNVARTLGINTSNPSIGTSWDIGEVWSYVYTHYTSSTSLRIVIVAKDTNNIVWQSTLAGASSTSYSPIIGSRGITPTTAYTGTKVYFYATVTDLDNDVSRVYVNASSLGLSSKILLLDSNGDGTYVSSSSYTAYYSTWNGKVIFFIATDSAGNNASAQFTVTISSASNGSSTSGSSIYDEYSSYLTNGTYPPNASGGEAGETSGQAGTTFYYIERASDGTITRNFAAGEKVYVILYSDTLRNLALLNCFYVYNPLTGGLVSSCSSSTAFQYAGIYGDFYAYNYTFTAPTSAYTYSVQINLKDNTGNVINIYDKIIVAGATYPKLETYKWNSTQGKLIKCTSFNDTDTVYLRIVTLDVDGVMTNVNLGDLTISDYSGEYILRATPSKPTTNSAGTATATYTAPLSTVYKGDTSSLFTSGTANATKWIKDGYYTATDSSATYICYMKLLDANCGWWLPGKNSYTLTINTFSDAGYIDGSKTNTGETYYDLTLQFNVTAPRSTADIIASIGSGSFTWSTTGASWSNNQIAWFKNGEVSGQWQKISIDSSTYSGPISMVQTDINGDGRKDLVVAFQDSTVAVAWYCSNNVEGTSWSSAYQIMAAKDGTNGTEADYTPHSKSGYSYEGGTSTGWKNADVTLYSSQASSFVSYYSGTYYVSSKDIIMAMAAGDFNGDGYTDLVISLVHQVVYSSSTSASDAASNPSENTAMYFNRGLYVLWNTGGTTNWKMTPLYGTRDFSPYLKQGSLVDCNGNYNGAAMDVATGDFNGDGYTDIAAVYENGTTKIWMSQWGNTGTATDLYDACFNVSASLIPSASVPTVGGTNPWGLSGKTVKIAVADMDNNGYPDIIRTSTSTNTVTVILTKPASATTTYKYPTFQSAGTSGKTAAVTGSLSTLSAVDSSYQTLTETYLNTSIIYQRASSLVSDTTGGSVSNLQYDDSSVNNVAKGTQLEVLLASADTTYQSMTLTNVTLRAKYSVDSGYDGSGYIQWSTDGTTWHGTSIKPVYSAASANVTINLKAAGVNTWTLLQSVYLRFYNNETGSAAVRFDYIWLEVTYAQTRQLEWTYGIPNVTTQILHNLTISAKLASSGEAFNVSYSVDNKTWFPLYQITSTTQKYYYSMLMDTSNSYYYIKITDADRSTSDTTNSTLYIDMVQLAHYSPTVAWSTGYSVTLTSLSTSYYITGLAVGDICKTTGDHTADGMKDVVITTSDISSSDYTHALYVITSTGTAFNTPISISMASAGAAVGSNKYVVSSVTLGDFNGDGYLDIAASLGFQPGYSYTAGGISTVWVYYNVPTTSSWTFTEQAVDVLDDSGSAINIKAGYVDLTILAPVFGVLGIVAAEAVIERYERRRKN